MLQSKVLSIDDDATVKGKSDRGKYLPFGARKRKFHFHTLAESTLILNKIYKKMLAESYTSTLTQMCRGNMDWTFENTQKEQKYSENLLTN